MKPEMTLQAQVTNEATTVHTNTYAANKSFSSYAFFPQGFFAMSISTTPMKPPLQLHQQTKSPRDHSVPEDVPWIRRGGVLQPQLKIKEEAEEKELSEQQSA